MIFDNWDQFQKGILGDDIDRKLKREDIKKNAYFFNMFKVDRMRLKQIEELGLKKEEEMEKKQYRFYSLKMDNPNIQQI